MSLSPYGDVNGPLAAVELALAPWPRCGFLVEPTGAEDLYCRRVYAVTCVVCGELVHPSTTGPLWHARTHAAEECRFRSCLDVHV